MVQKTVRLPGFLVDRLEKEMRPRGYTSLSAFIRIALQNELDRCETAQRTASTMDRLARELQRLDTTHQAEFRFFGCAGTCDSPLPARATGRNP